MPSPDPLGLHQRAQGKPHHGRRDRASPGPPAAPDRRQPQRVDGERAFTPSGETDTLASAVGSLPDEAAPYRLPFAASFPGGWSHTRVADGAVHVLVPFSSSARWTRQREVVNAAKASIRQG